MTARPEVAALVGLGALHAAWAAGASFPARDRAALAAAVVGSDTFPSGASSAAVAGALFAAAGLVLRGHPRPVGAVFAARGAVGLLRPQLLPAGRRPPFPKLNARVYSPFCLALGAALMRRCSPAARASTARP